jgi:peptidoglycan/LPS O-acetylase OafA/YrhL
MPRFPEIEGLRAWLAWTVVVTHCFVVLNYFPRIAQLLDGSDAVGVFVMISGFLITGLVLDRKETWGRFITRRAFRIFPAYLVALALGAVTQPLAVAGLATTTWGSDAWSWIFAARSGAVASIAEHPWAQWLLHLTLLQGIVPDNVLPWSSVSFVGPAWSLSLEWQFYLVAPALIWAMRSKVWAPCVVLMALIATYLFRQGMLGEYSNYANLAGGLWLFVIGIASRLALPTLKKIAPPFVAVAIAGLALAVTVDSLRQLGVWIAFVAFLARPASANILLNGLAKTVSALLASWLPRTLGERSYSVYVIHMPILELLLFVLPLHALTQIQAFALITPLAIILTLIASELMHRFVERPMIKMGAQLAAPRLVAQTT